MKQADWPKYTCPVCNTWVSAPTKHVPTCKHIGTPREARKPASMIEVEE